MRWGVGNPIIANLQHDIGEPVGGTVQVESMRHTVFGPVGLVAAYSMGTVLLGTIEHHLGKTRIGPMQHTDLYLALFTEVHGG
jgi:hypothetical protein